MIFYFSGTGNSKWVATQLAEQLGEETANLAALPSNQPLSFQPDQLVGLVFPIYAWNAPQMVTQFAKRLTSNGAFSFAIATCGEDCGNAMKNLSKVLSLRSAYSLTMPNNYILGSDIDSPDRARSTIAQARAALPNIAQQLQNRQPTVSLTQGPKPFLRSQIISPLFNRFARITKPFHTLAERCNSCGSCVKTCPIQTIQLVDNLPQWGKDCAQCLACINRCPREAIQYGKNTENRGRYYLEQLTEPN